jgi:hypothetical protein
MLTEGLHDKLRSDKDRPDATVKRFRISALSRMVLLILSVQECRRVLSTRLKLFLRFYGHHQHLHGKVADDLAPARPS